MSATALIQGVIGGASASPLVLYGLQRWFEKDTRQSDKDAKNHDSWRRDFETNYDILQDRCTACITELERVKGELFDVREALVGRIDAFEELLPHVNGLSEDKMAELRRINRAQRQAVWKGRP